MLFLPRNSISVYTNNANAIICLAELSYTLSHKSVVAGGSVKMMTFSHFTDVNISTHEGTSCCD